MLDSPQIGRPSAQLRSRKVPHAGTPIRRRSTAASAAPRYTNLGEPQGESNTGYTSTVAKVMVSLPDDLLRAVDVEAARRGTTRSGYLRELAEETLRRRSMQRAERMAEIEEMGDPPVGHGGGVAEAVKATRPGR